MDVFSFTVYHWRKPWAAYAAGDRTKVQAMAAELQRCFPRRFRRCIARHPTCWNCLRPGHPRRSPNFRPRTGGCRLPGPGSVVLRPAGGPPLGDRVPLEKPGAVFSSRVGGQFFEQGLYAHAPSKRELELDGKWARFPVVRTACRMATPDRWSSSCVAMVGNCSAHRWLKVKTLRKLDVDVHGVNLFGPPFSQIETPACGTRFAPDL